MSKPDPVDGTPHNRHRWAGLIFISIAVSVIIVDSTIVNVTIPSIVQSLSATSSQVQWIQESYTLVFASLLLLAGSLADRIGRRRMLLVGVVVFALSSVFAASAGSGDFLIASRFAQGVGGAMILPTTLSLVNTMFHGRERGIAFAVWGSTIGGMTALGPLLGGWLTTDFTWRYAFGINIPIGIIVIVGILLFVPESRSREDGERTDVLGAILSIITLGSFVFGLIEGRTYGWWTVNQRFALGSWQWPGWLSPIPVAFGIAIVFGAIFIARGRSRERSGKPSMIPHDLFRIRSFRNGNLAALIVSLGEFGIILSLPIWLQNVLGYSALRTGVLLLALAIGSFVASGFAGAFSHRLNAIVVVRVGIAAELVGVAWLGFAIGPDTQWWQIVPPLFVYGFGVGLATAQLTSVVLVDVPLSQSGRGSGAQSTSRQLGSALGIAVLGSVLYSSTSAVLRHAHQLAALPNTARGNIVDAVVNSSGAAISTLSQHAGGSAIASAAKVALSDGARYSAFTAAGFLVIGLFATLRLGGGAQPSGQTTAERQPERTADGTDNGQ